MVYIKSTRTQISADSGRQTSSLYSQCLGAWYFARPTHYYPDLTYGRHILTRRTTGTQTVTLESKFPAQTPYNGTSTPADTVEMISTTYDGICNAISTYKNFSFAVWVNLATSDNKNGMILEIGGEVDPYRYNYGIFMDGSVNGRFEFRTGGDVEGPVSTVSKKDGLWHLVVCTHNNTASANKRKIYIDGVLDNSDNTAMTVISTGGVRLLHGEDVSSPCSYKLFFLGIWGRELNYQEIKRMYNEPMTMLNNPLRNDPRQSRTKSDFMPFF